MPIRTQVDSARELTTITVNGEVSFDEIMATSKEFYSEKPTLKVIWDFSKGTGAGVSFKQIEKLAEFVCKMDLKVRKVKKLAMVTPKDLDYGLLRMAQTFLELNNYKPEHRLFRQFENAIAWIDGESDEVQ